MHASVRSLALAACLSLAAPLFAGTDGVYLPPAPQGPGGEDTIESSTGTRCRQSINSNGAYLDVGVAGTAAGGGPKRDNAFIGTNDRDREGLAYARVTVPLGRQPKRIDCARVFELEIARLKREIELMKMNVE